MCARIFISSCARALFINLIDVCIYFNFTLHYFPHSYICVVRNCAHIVWLLLKCSTVGIGFNGAETNCGIAHILGILLMNSYNTVIFLATSIICSLSTLNQ